MVFVTNNFEDKDPLVVFGKEEKNPPLCGVMQFVITNRSFSLKNFFDMPQKEKLRCK